MAHSTDGEAPAYDDDFFALIAEGARRSAGEVVPLIKAFFAPASIVDVGGGGGHWAAAFRAIGINDVTTIDGPWVPQSARVIPPEQFREHDLSKPLTLERDFDLALSLEAAEHLPAAAADDLVRVLTEAAPVVIFSAAPPGQGGHGHINEQRASYWVSLFAEHGYACFTDLRSRIWHNQTVEVYYRQNLLCFIRGSELHRWTDRLSEQREPDDPLLDVAHPEMVLLQKSYIDDWEASSVWFKSQAAWFESEAARLHTELEAIINSRGWRTLQKIRRPIRRLKGKKGAK
jgi:hypothetical protein